MIKVGVIDADPIAYICSKDTLQESLDNVDDLISNALNAVHCSHYYMFLSDSPYFRHQVNTEYKGKRPTSELKYLEEIKQYLRDKYGGVSYEGLEADDLSAYVMTTVSIASPQFSFINMSIDKDVLQSVWGPWFNFKKFESGKTTKKDAAVFIFLQTLMGDVTDNIKGIPGVGEVKANNILATCKTLDEMRGTVLNEYCKKFKSTSVGIYEFQKNFRQVYLLRNTEDFKNEVGYIPKLPKLRITERWEEV